MISYDICLSIWLHSVWSSLGLSMCCWWQCLILFYGQVIVNCIYIYTAPLLYPFICWWTFRLFPCLGSINSTSVNTGVRVSFWSKIFISSGYMPRSGITGSYGACMLSHFSCVQLFETLWTVAHQALLSKGFSRQEYWSGLLGPPPGGQSYLP